MFNMTEENRVSGGNKQICLAIKERSYCESIQKKSFKTSETYCKELDLFF